MKKKKVAKGRSKERAFPAGKTNKCYYNSAYEQSVILPAEEQYNPFPCFLIDSLNKTTTPTLL